jgi:hypothetical protein
MRGSAVAAHVCDLGLLPHFDDIAALQVGGQAVHEAGPSTGWSASSLAKAFKKASRWWRCIGAAAAWTAAISASFKASGVDMGKRLRTGASPTRTPRRLQLQGADEEEGVTVSMSACRGVRRIFRHRSIERPKVGDRRQTRYRRSRHTMAR